MQALPPITLVDLKNQSSRGRGSRTSLAIAMRKPDFHPSQPVIIKGALTVQRFKHAFSSHAGVRPMACHSDERGRFETS